MTRVTLCAVTGTHAARGLAALVGLFCIAPAVVATQAAGFHSISIIRLAPPCAPLAACRNATSSTPSSISVLPGGRFEARNQTIENLVRVAYGFEQIDLAVGVVAESKFSSPDAERFDVTAVADREWPRAPAGEKVPGEFRAMLRALLEERFKLRARVALTDVDVLALQLARVDRQRGPGLRRSTSDCQHGTSVEPGAGDSRPPCMMRIDATHIEAGGITMSQLAAMIYDAEGARVDRFVVDQTGLSGRYDVALSIAAAGDRRDAFRDALKMQLGLKLVKTKVSLPTLLIEHAETPPAS